MKVITLPHSECYDRLCDWSFIVTYSLIFSTKKAERLENVLFQILLQLGVACIELQLMEYMYVY